MYNSLRGTRSYMRPVGRKPKQLVPSEEKDGRYWEKRARNNEAARRSREHRRNIELDVRQRLTILEKENASMAQELSMIKQTFGLDQKKRFTTTDSAESPRVKERTKYAVSYQAHRRDMQSDSDNSLEGAHRQYGNEAVLPAKKRRYFEKKEETPSSRYQHLHVPTIKTGYADISEYMFQSPQLFSSYAASLSPHRHIREGSALFMPPGECGIPQRHSPLNGYTPPETAYMSGFYPVVPPLSRSVTPESGSKDPCYTTLQTKTEQGMRLATDNASHRETA